MPLGTARVGYSVALALQTWPVASLVAVAVTVSDPGRLVVRFRTLNWWRLVATGLANKQIARRLGIAEKTVKAHLTNLFQRLGVTDRTQAALWAERHGLLSSR